MTFLFDSTVPPLTVPNRVILMGDPAGWPVPVLIENEMAKRKLKIRGCCRYPFRGAKERARAARYVMVHTYPNGQPIPGHGIINQRGRK